MAVRCSAKQIADLVVLLGMTGTIPEYCKNADDALNLKSLDLITSTLNIFVEAFDLYFEDIYRKCEVNSPLSEETFIEFLKPRCLLLTKDNRCFNFILVCAFVFEMIHSFSHYNKCFHLVKAASKCLAAILKNRFKRIFQADSNWKGLMSFCIKMHGLVYPAADKCESGDKQLVGVVTDKTGASFVNTAQELAELPKEKHVTDDNNDYLDTKTTRKNSYTSLQSESTSEIKEELKYLSISEFPTSSPVQTLQLAGEGSRKSENKENIVDESSRRDNEKDCAKDASFLDLSKENLMVLSEKMSIRSNATEKPKEKLTRISEGYLTIKTEEESSKDLCSLEFPSTDAKDTFQNRKTKKRKSLKVEDSSLKKAENKDKIFFENDARNNNEIEMTDSSLSEFVKEFTNVSSKQTLININKEANEDNEKFDLIAKFKKNKILPFEDYLAVKKVLEKVEFFCNLGLFSTDASHTLQQKIGDLSPKEENIQKPYSENTGKRYNEEDCVINVTNSSLFGLAKDSNHFISEKTVINITDNEKFHEMISFKKSLSLSHEVYLAIKKALEKLEDLCILGFSSIDVAHTPQLKTEHFSPKEENIYNKNDGKKSNEKKFSTGTMDSSIQELTKEFTDMVSDQTTNNNKTDNERCVQIMISKKNVILYFKDYLEFKKVVGKLEDLCNLGLSSIGASEKLQSKVEDSYPEQADGKGKIHDENDARKDNYPSDYNRRDHATEMADSSLNVSNKKSSDVVSEETTLNNNKGDNEKLNEVTVFKKNVTFSYEDYTAIKKVVEKLEDFCNLGLSSTAALHTSQLKVEKSSPKEDNKEKIHNENDGKRNNEKDCVQNMAVSLVSNLEERTNITINNRDVDIENLFPMIACTKALIGPSKKETAIKRIQEMLQLHNLKPDSSTGASYTCRNAEDFSPNAESEDNKIIDISNAKDGNENATFSLAPNLTLKPAKTSIEKKDIDKYQKGGEKLGQMNSWRKILSLPLNENSSAQKTAKKLVVPHNLGPVASTDAQLKMKMQLKDENAELEDIMIVDKTNAIDKNVTFSLVPNLANESTEIKKNAIDKNLKASKKLEQMKSCRKKLILPLTNVAKKLSVSHNLESGTSTDAPPTLQLKDENGKSGDKRMIVDKSNAKFGSKNVAFSLVPNLAHKLTKTSIEKKDTDNSLKGDEKPGQVNRCRKKLFLSFSKDSKAQKAAQNLAVSHNLESVTSIGVRSTLQLKDKNAESEDKTKVDERNASEENVSFLLVANLANEPTEIEKKATERDENLKGAEKPEQMKNCRKKLSLPLRKDSNTQNTTKELVVSQNLELVNSTDAQPTPQLKNEQFSSKHICNMSANEIRTYITDDPVHLLKTLELLKTCKEDIGPNLFAPDEYDIPIDDADENVEMEAGCGSSESSSNNDITFKSYIKATLFYKSMKMADSIKRIFLEGNPSNDVSAPKASGGESPHEMSDEVAYLYGHLILESDDPHCSSCAGGMESFFDASVNNFNTKYSNNNEVSDLFRPLL